MKLLNLGEFVLLEQFSPNCYPILSPLLQDDLEKAGNQIQISHSNFTKEEFINFRSKMIGFTDLFDCYGNTYHNLAHALFAENAVEEICKLNADDLEITTYEHLVRIGALVHDFAHPGSRENTLRLELDFLNPNALQHFSEDRILTNEEFTVILVDFFTRNYLTIYERILLQGLIMSTTFGNKNIKPRNKLEEVITTSDVSSFRAGFNFWIEERFLRIREQNPQRRERSFHKWLESCYEFLLWIKEYRMPDYIEKIWKEGFDEVNSILTNLIRGEENHLYESLARRFEEALTSTEKRIDRDKLKKLNLEMQKMIRMPIAA